MVRKKTETKLHTPKITVSTEKKGGKNIETAQYQLAVPGAYVDEIRNLIGDGNARVTVSADFGIKDFGTGASAMCSVSLTCDQSAKGIEEAARIAGEMARDIAQEQRARAENELNAVIAER